jgi:hypothetical protein
MNDEKRQSQSNANVAFRLSRSIDVGTNRPFAGVAFDKMRSASAKPATQQAPGTQCRFKRWG